MQDARIIRPLEFPKEGVSIETANQSWLVLGSLSLGLLVYVAMAVALVRSVHPHVPGSGAFMPEFRVYVRPEPMERMLYLVGLASIPTLPTLFYGLLACGSRRFPRLGRWVANPCLLGVRDGLVAGFVLLWLGFLAHRSQIPAASYYLAAACLPAVLAPLATAGASTARPWAIRWAAAGVILAAWALLFWERSEIGSHLGATLHFDLLLGAVNQVMHGRTILVDATSQYGILYPYVAAAVVAPFGLSATHLSLFFLGLSLLSLALVYLIYARKMGSGSPWALVCLLATLAVLHPSWNGALFHYRVGVVYYQYFPLRVICGVFFLWFAGVYFQRPSRRLMLAGYLAAAASVLWNADTGIVVLVAWTASLMVDAVSRRRLEPVPKPLVVQASRLPKQPGPLAVQASRLPKQPGPLVVQASRLPKQPGPLVVQASRLPKQPGRLHHKNPIAARVAGHLAMLVLTLVVSVGSYALLHGLAAAGCRT